VDQPHLPVFFDGRLVGFIEEPRAERSLLTGTWVPATPEGLPSARQPDGGTPVGVGEDRRPGVLWDLAGGNVVVELEAARLRSVRRTLAALVGLAGLGLAVGLWAFLPYLEREHRRLEPWKSFLVWVGDLTAFLWFVRFTVRHFLLRKPFPSRAGPLGAEWLFAWFSLLLALGWDLGVTLSVRHDERAGYQRAEVAAGQVVSLAVKEYPTAVWYHLECEYADRAGVRHAAHFTVLEARPEGFRPDVPGAVKQALRARQVPFPLPVAYDPRWPARSWVAGSGWDDGHRLHHLSLLILLYQAMSLPLFALLLCANVRPGGAYPWWYDLHQAFPFLVEAAVFLLFGAAELLVPKYR
jgi:hypothetical protein